MNKFHAVIPKPPLEGWARISAGSAAEGSFSLSFVLTFMVLLSLFCPTILSGEKTSSVISLPGIAGTQRTGQCENHPYDKVTIINYALPVRSRMDSRAKKPYADASLCRFVDPRPAYHPGSSLIAVAHKHGVVMLS
jgi:hypothetical protein